jgi:hypothetical protein
VKLCFYTTAKELSHARGTKKGESFTLPRANFGVARSIDSGPIVPALFAAMVNVTLLFTDLQRFGCQPNQLSQIGGQLLTSAAYDKYRHLQWRRGRNLRAHSAT